MRYIKFFAAYIVPIATLIVSVLIGIPGIKKIFNEPQISFEVLDQKKLGFDGEAGANFKIIHNSISYTDMTVSRIFIKNETGKVITPQDYFSGFSIRVSFESKVAFASVFHSGEYIDSENISIERDRVVFPGQFMNPGDGVFVTIYSEGEIPTFKVYSKIANVSNFNQVVTDHINYWKVTLAIITGVAIMILASYSYATMMKFHVDYKLSLDELLAPAGASLIGVILGMELFSDALIKGLPDLSVNYGIGLVFVVAIICFLIPVAYKAKSNTEK